MARFKIENCLENDQFPAVYKIKTKKLEFTIPKALVKINKTHVHIPNDYYKQIIGEFNSKN